ncbi:hypothetical protein [Actinocorallia sp. A-T 12471]|uniref:hypothetical protein n=1 Tax=Actinocorallia sp. A-T 12471 TaxID=3089813 RepID=UPI0029CAD50B|nr:hypothetical protein [Actinocorallia sp. A-T 12471]MDX6744982.1 hypothetical protein [Actinocorallia sp. A-T 12471]
MRPHLPWLCQGDIFSDAPIVDIAAQGTGGLEASLIYGPAILITHDCAMDKPDKDGNPRVQHFQLVRLRSMSALPQDRRGNLKGGRAKVPPFEAMYVGDVGDLGESFILLSDPYFLPAGYFAPGFVDYRGHAEADPQVTNYITPLLNDSRIGRLEEDQIQLLRRKIIAFWTRMDVI